MTWEQYVAFLKGLGVTVPVDLTDPRLDAAKLTEVRKSVQDAYAEARKSGKPLADIKRLADAAVAVQTEIDTRTEVAKLDEDLAKLGGDPEPEPEPEGDDDGDEDAEAKKSVAQRLDKDVDLVEDKPLLVPDPTTGDGSLSNADSESKKLALAATAALAAAEGTQSDKDRDGATGGSVVRAPMVAAISSGGMEFGTEVDAAKLARLIEEVTVGVKAGMSGFRAGDPDRRIQVASVLAYGDRPGHDDSMVLSLEKGPQANTDIIRKALAAHTRAVKAGEQSPMTAATFCPPFDVIRDIPDSTSTATPLRDSLAFVPFSHGGFTFNAGVQFADVAGAVDIWTETDQDNVDPDDSSTWKPVYEIVCPTPTTLRADDWITAGVTWKVGMDINNPENVADVFKKVEGQRARRMEQYLLSMLDPLLTNYRFNTTASIGSSIPDLVAALVASFEAAGYDSRLRGDVSYTMYLDTGLLGNLVVDRSRTAFGIGRESEGVLSYLRDVISEAELPIDRFVRLMERQPVGTSGGKGFDWGALKANGNPFVTATYPPAANGNMVDGPDLLTKFRVRLVPTSEVFAFGTGEIRTGIRQDFAMARQNKLGWFVEEAVKLGKHGVSPWFALNLELCPSGARTGWVDPDDVACGSTLGS